jgi:Zn-dependent peptidase ImmA (M78 family)
LLEVPDFRLLPEGQIPYSPALLYEIRRSFERRTIALEILSEFGEEPPAVPMEPRNLSADGLARKIRDALQISLEDQFGWREHYTALRSWTSAVERIGILVFHVSNVEVSEMRGFSISEYPLPVIGLNGKDSPRGRVFTLLHELAHIMLREGGICDLREGELEQARPLEAYCNQVAAEALVPGSALLRERTVVENGPDPIWTNEQLRYLANRFMVSQEVLLRRLLTLGRTTGAFYRWKRRDWQEGLEEERPPGFIAYHRRVLRDNGRAYTRLVLSAFYNDLISSRDLSTFLGGINLRHLGSIEQALASHEGGQEA